MAILSVKEHGSNKAYVDFTPSSYTFGLSDVSSANSGRTSDGQMHKNRIAQKRTIQLLWNNPSPELTAKILTAFNPEYIDVKYIDAMTNSVQVRTFYVGDRTAPLYTWCEGKKIYSRVQFNIIER